MNELSKLPAKDNNQSDNSSPERDSNPSNDGLDLALTRIADATEVLACKAQRPDTEKEWDKAERDRKRKHDDRTFSRQGWAIIVASIALAFNFIGLIVAITSSYTSRESVRTAFKSVDIAQKSLNDSNKYHEIDLEPLVKISLPKSVDLDSSHMLNIDILNSGTHDLRFAEWHIFANRPKNYDFNINRQKDDAFYPNSSYQNVLMPGESTTIIVKKPFYINNENSFPYIFIAFTLGIKSPSGKIFAREVCRLYRLEDHVFHEAGWCPSFEDMRLIK